MPTIAYGVFRECGSPDCGFRFPDVNSIEIEACCPRCGQPATIVANLDLLQDQRPTLNNFRNVEVTCVLDNIRSVYNTGSIFRTMQGFGVSKAYLCGITPSPEHPQFGKTSMGAETQVH